MNASLFFAVLLLPQTTVPSPEVEAEQRAKGQKYLDQVAAAWKVKLPQDRLLGLYMGRQWMGTLRLGLKAGPPGGGTFDFTLRQDCKLYGHSTQVELHAVLDAKLAPLSAERTETVDQKVMKSKLTLADGKWTVADDARADRHGTAGPGQTVEANLFPLFVRPEEDGLLVLCPIGDKGANTYVRQAEKVERTFDGKKQACSVLKIGHLSIAPDLWYYSEDGRPLEMRQEVKEGSPSIRLRPIVEAAVGKALTEPIEVKPAERRVLDFFVAIRKNDAISLAACFDFDRFAKEAIPNFAGATPVDQKKAIANLRQSMLKNLLADEKARASQPEPAALEDTMAAVMTSTEENGVATVAIKGSDTWKLHQPTEGPRKGQWLIFLISE